MTVVILKDKAKYVCVVMDIHNNITRQVNLFNVNDFIVFEF